MATAVESLFGITPEGLQAQRENALQARALQFAQLDPIQQAQMGLYAAGNRLGGGLGGLLGAQDPELERIRKRQQLLQGAELADPVALRQVAQQAATAGDYILAEGLITRAADLEKTASEIYKNQQAGRTSRAQAIPADIQKAQRIAELKAGIQQLSGIQNDPSAAEATQRLKDELAVYESSDPKVSDLARKITEAYGFPVGSPEFMQKMQEMLEAERKGKEKGTGNVSLGGISIDTGTAAKEAAKVVGKAIGEVENKYSIVDSLGEAKRILEAGDIFTGFYGSAGMMAAKATSKNNPKVVRTEEFISYLGNVVVPRLKEFGGSDSNEELKYLQKIVGGDLSMEQEALKRVLNSAEKKINKGIERLQRQADAAATGKPAPLDPGPTRQAEATQPRTFTSVQEAEAANLPKGTRIIINGRRAIVE